MTKVLVVDDIAIIRDPIAASLRLAGFESLCAADGEEALMLTRQHHPDVILLDVSMPKMDGLAFLKALRTDPTIAHIHVILLTAMSEKKYVVAAATLGVRDYLLKSRFRLSELIERIKKSNVTEARQLAVKSVGTPPSQPASTIENVAASTSSVQATEVLKAVDGEEIPQLLTREQFFARVKEIFKTKTLSGVVAQVIALASSPRGDMAQLVALIAKDPMLSVRVLQTANSASYSTGVIVTTIPDAIRKLGFTTVRNVAAALGVFDCMPVAGVDGFDPIRCWQHSFAVAQICDGLAKIALPEKSGLAYVVGLCHDLGEIFLRTQFGKEYAQVIETATRTGRSFEELHARMLGMTETQMLSEILKTIALPPALREPIEILHSAKRTTTTDPLARLLWMAENYANAALIASSPSSEIDVFTLAQCKAAAGDANPPLPDSTTLRTQVLSLTITLARLPRSEEAKLLIPMFVPTAAKLWIATAPGISKSDPVSLALSSLAEVSVKQRLPQPEELRQFNGLVVLSPTTNTPGFSSKDIDAVIANASTIVPEIATLRISSDSNLPDQQRSSAHWRDTISLADLSSFVEAVVKARDLQAAA